MPAGQGFKGISYPFRFSPTGGVATSTTSATDSSHIKESVIQIIRTQLNERSMELDFGTNSLAFLFEPVTGDSTILSVAKFSIQKALEMWEHRIKVNSIDVVPDQVQGATLNVTVYYTVIQFQLSDSVTVQLQTQSS